MTGAESPCKGAFEPTPNVPPRSARPSPRRPPHPSADAAAAAVPATALPAGAPLVTYSPPAAAQPATTTPTPRVRASPRRAPPSLTKDDERLGLLIGAYDSRYVPPTTKLPCSPCSPRPSSQQPRSPRTAQAQSMSPAPKKARTPLRLVPDPEQTPQLTSAGDASSPSPAPRTRELPSPSLIPKIRPSPLARPVR